MSNGTPWFRRPEIIIPAIVMMLAAIIGGIFVLISSPQFPTTPMFKEIGGDTDANGDYEISWESSERAISYILQEDSNPSFTNPRTVYAGSETKANIYGKSNGDYYYRARACNKAGESEWSPIRKITVMIAPPSTPTPTSTVTPTTTPTPILTLTPTPTPAPSSFTPIYVPEAYYPSGWMGDWGDITLDDSYTDNPHSDPICIKIIYSAAKSQGEGWAGIYWQHPDSNWGDKIGGYDLTDATKLTLWARGEKGGEKAEFKVGGITTGEYPDSLRIPASTGVVILSDSWQQYTIDLTGKDLSHIIGGFAWATTKSRNPYGCTIYLDDIRYE